MGGPRIPVAAVLCALAVAGTVAPVAAQPARHGASLVLPPTGWHRHVSAPWVWWTPRHWVAAHGPYDLDISSPTRAKWVKYGYSGAPYFASLTPAANAKKWFHDLLANYRDGSRKGPGLYSRALASDHYTALGTIHQVPAMRGYALQWRQTAQFVGRRADGVLIQGEMVLDYAENPPSGFDVFGNAAESQQVRAAPATRFTTSIGTLRLIQRLIHYCGGTC